MTHTLAETANASTTAQSGEIGTYTASFGISLGLTSLFNALLVVIKETNEATVLAWMKAAGHHWITHGVLDLVVFVALGFILAKFARSWTRAPGKVAAVAVGGVVGGALIIAAFYLSHAV